MGQRWRGIGAVLAILTLPGAATAQVYNNACASAGMVTIVNYSTAVIYNDLSGASAMNKVNPAGNTVVAGNYGFVAPLGVPYAVGPGRQAGAADGVAYNYALLTQALGPSSVPTFGGFQQPGASGNPPPYAFFPIIATGNTAQANGQTANCSTGSSGTCFITTFSLFAARPYCAPANGQPPPQGDACAAAFGHDYAQQYIYMMMQFNVGTQISTPKVNKVSVFNILNNLGNAITDIAGIASGDPKAAIGGALMLAGEAGTLWNSSKSANSGTANNLYFMALNSMRVFPTSLNLSAPVQTTAPLPFNANGSGAGFSPVFSTDASTVDPHVYALQAVFSGGNSLPVPNRGSNYSFTIHLSTQANDQYNEGNQPTGRSCPSNYVIALFEDGDYASCIAQNNGGAYTPVSGATCPLASSSGGFVNPGAGNAISPFGPEGIGQYLYDRPATASRKATP